MADSIANDFALYLKMVSQSIRSQLQYRLSFLLMSIGNFVTSGVEAFGVWALFDRFGTLGQWSLPQIAFLYGLVNCVFAVAEGLARGFDIFGSEFVKTGNFDRLLLRPRSTVLQLAGHEFQIHRIGRFVQGAVVFGWAVWMLGIDWHAGKVLLLVFTFVAGVAFFYALFIIQATFSFWATESLEIMNTLTYGGVETAQYPLAIYRKVFRRFFTYIVPLGCITYFPAIAVFGIDDPLGSSRLFQYMAPCAGLGFFAAAIFLWRFGIRHYTSTGS
ncbi:MAG: ABC-2 family transporter protein [Proteobacteria bacterium]|nr:ABC-2 family transporter protein [Pseudomonadota bacterium]